MIKMQSLLSIVIAIVLLALLSCPGMAAPPPQTPEPPSESSSGGDSLSPSILKDAVDNSAATIAPIGDTIDIALSSETEADPAVALCAYDQYLVVYERNNEIYGQRLDSEGNLLGSAFQISDDTLPDAEPDVACEWTYNRFVVVWEHDFGGAGTDYDIRAQVVYGGHQTSGSQLWGSRVNVSEDGSEIDERDPAIACNSNDHTCLVTFEYSNTGSGDIYGQRLYMGSSDFGTDGDRFNVSEFGVEEYNPDVAWGGYDDNYLVVWQYLHNDPSDHYRIVVSHVYDTEQGAGQEERQHGGSWLINPADGWSRHQFVPAVAYSHDVQDYLVVFQYDYYGDGSDYDIVARRYEGTGTSVPGAPFSVAQYSVNESSPAVAFSGGPESLPGGMGADQFLVTFVREETSARTLYAQAITGAHNSSGSQLEGDARLLYSTLKALGWGIYSPDVTGSINNGRYMTVWERDTGGTVWDKDVLGRMVAPYVVYLPFVLRNH